MSTGAIVAIIVFVLAIIVSNIYLVKKSAKFGIKKPSDNPPAQTDNKGENNKPD